MVTDKDICALCWWMISKRKCTNPTCGREYSHALKKRRKKRLPHDNEGSPRTFRHGTDEDLSHPLQLSKSRDEMNEKMEWQLEVLKKCADKATVGQPCPVASIVWAIEKIAELDALKAENEKLKERCETYAIDCVAYMKDSAEQLQQERAAAGKLVEALEWYKDADNYLSDKEDGSEICSAYRGNKIAFTAQEAISAYREQSENRAPISEKQTKERKGK